MDVVVVVVGIVAGLVALWVALVLVLWLLRPRGVRLRELLWVVPDLVRLLRLMITDRATPADVRVVLVLLLAWILSPIDLVPEFIPVLGPLDDVIVTIVALRYARRRVGLAAIRSRWPGSADGFALVARLLSPE